VSFDLGVWDTDRPPRTGEAERRYEQLCEGQDPAGNPSPRVTAFVEECGRRWPGETDEDSDESPWASWPLTSPRTTSGFVANIRPGAAAGMFGEWAEMAERHGLVLYDPQSGVVKIPSRLSYDARPPPPTGAKRRWFAIPRRRHPR